MNDDTTGRLDRLESLVDRQAEMIEALREQVAEMDGGASARDDESRTSVTRRTALKAGGLAGLLALGSGVASADPQGQVGTAADPLRTLYTQEINGGLTGGTAVTDLVGAALRIDAGTLGVDPLIQPPEDVVAVLGGMARDGDGTYVITNVHELQAMSADLGADYRLDNDVDAVGTALWNGGRGFEPIGDSNDRFRGSLDGDGHVVEGLTIDRGNEDDVGLLGVVDFGVPVERIGLVDLDVTGHTRVGGLVGQNLGQIDVTYTTGRVSGFSTVGGLVGSNGRESVFNSYAVTQVVGYESVGGLIGVALGVLDETYAAGEVDGNSGVGGLLGEGSFPTISASYWDVPASGIDGSFAGGTGLGTLADVPPADEMVGAAAATNMNLDFTNTWETVSGSDPATVRDGYPVLRGLDRETQLEARR